MKGTDTFPLHRVDGQVQDTDPEEISPRYRPRGNQAAIKWPLGETISSPSMALVTSPLFEAVYSKYFLSSLMGDAKEEIGLNLLANSPLSAGQPAARTQEISVFSQLVIK